MRYGAVRERGDLHEDAGLSVAVDPICLERRLRLRADRYAVPVRRGDLVILDVAEAARVDPERRNLLVAHLP